MMQEVAEQARAIIGAHQAVISLTQGRDWAQAITALSLSDKYAAYRHLVEPPDGSGIYAVVCETNRPLRLTQAELEAHPRWRGFGAYADQHPPMRGWLAVPLTGRDGSNIGVLQLSDKDGGRLHPAGRIRRHRTGRAGPDRDRQRPAAGPGPGAQQRPGGKNRPAHRAN